MRLPLLLIVSFWASGVMAQQCFPEFNETDLVNSVGLKALKKTPKKESGKLIHQYEFREDVPFDKVLSDDEAKYEPQFYLTVYEPPCSKKITIWFYSDNENTANLSNITLAGRAFKYLTGVEPSIFENKINRFKSVQHFDSFDDKADSRFLKSGNLTSIEVNLK